MENAIVRYLAIAMLVSGSAFAVDNPDDPDNNCGRETTPESHVLVDATALNGYVIEHYRNPEMMWEDTQKIRLDGKVVYEILACGLHDVITPKNAREHWWYEEEPPAQTSTDIDGDGSSELILFYFTGGAHCCLGYRIYSLGNDVVLMDQGPPKEYGYAIDDVDKDGVIELRTADDTFAYWFVSYAESAGPRVILSYDKKKGKFVANPELMKTELPSQEDHDAAVARIKEQFTPENTEHLEFMQEDRAWKPLPSIVWIEMLDLIYTGHTNAAMVLLDDVWPQGKTGKDVFIADLQAALHSSAYAEELADWFKLEL